MAKQGLPGRGGAHVDGLCLCERLVEREQLEALGAALLHDGTQPVDSLIPPVSEQLGVQCTHDERAVDTTLSRRVQPHDRARDEVRGVRARELQRRGAVVGFAVVVPRLVLVNGVVVVVAVAPAAG